MQLDLVGGVPLAGGREAKLLTCVDDHSRYGVIATVVVVPSGSLSDYLCNRPI
jgi:hypothetical protein